MATQTSSKASYSSIARLSAKKSPSASPVPLDSTDSVCQAPASLPVKTSPTHDSSNSTTTFQGQKRDNNHAGPSSPLELSQDSTPRKQDGMSANVGAVDRPYHNAKSTERVLSRWNSSTGQDASIALEESSGNGSWDQFAVNEKLFGCKTDFDENLYTTLLDRSNPNFKKIEKEADRIAKEIQSSFSSNIHISEERMHNVVRDDSICEEERYSSVIRNPNAYVPPAFRKHVQATASSQNKDKHKDASTEMKECETLKERESPSPVVQNNTDGVFSAPTASTQPESSSVSFLEENPPVPEQAPVSISVAKSESLSKKNNNEKKESSFQFNTKAAEFIPKGPFITTPVYPDMINNMAPHAPYMMQMPYYYQDPYAGHIAGAVPNPMMMAMPATPYPGNIVQSHVPYAYHPDGAVYFYHSQVPMPHVKQQVSTTASSVKEQTKTVGKDDDL